MFLRLSMQFTLDSSVLQPGLDRIVPVINLIQRFQNLMSKFLTFLIHFLCIASDAKLSFSPPVCSIEFENVLALFFCIRRKSVVDYSSCLRTAVKIHWEFVLCARFPSVLNVTIFGTPESCARSLERKKIGECSNYSVNKQRVRSCS